MYGNNTWPVILFIATVLILTAIIVTDRVRRKRAGKSSTETVGYSQFQDRGEIRDPEAGEATRPDMASTSMIIGIIGIFLFHGAPDFDRFVKNEIAGIPEIIRTSTYVVMHVSRSPWNHNLDIAALCQT